jgi:hypothetical protein
MNQKIYRVLINGKSTIFRKKYTSNGGRNMTTILIIVLVIILVPIGIGLKFIFFPSHHEVVSYRDYFSPQLQTWLYLKYTSKDGFIAGNPIDVDIQSGIVTNIQSLQLTFDGAGSYFPGNYNYTTMDISKLKEQQEKMVKDMNNIVPLELKTTKVSEISHFEGSINNLVYGQGGNFDIGFTYVNKEQGVVGYGMSQIENKIVNGISIASPETLLTIRNNNLLTGISLITVGISIFIPLLIKVLS